MEAIADVVALLRTQITRIERRHGIAVEAEHFSTGFIDLDAHCSGGLRRGAVHELLGTGSDASLCARPTRFLARLLGRTTGHVVWIGGPRLDLHLEGLRAAGLTPGRLLCVEVPPEQVLAVAEDVLREPGIAAVVIDLAAPFSLTASRRLTLAAEASGATGFVLHRTASGLPPPTACWSRWRIGGAPYAPTASGGRRYLLASERWSIDLLRLRGGEAASFTLEIADDAPHSVPLAAGMAHATLDTPPPRRPALALVTSGFACA